MPDTKNTYLPPDPQTPPYTDPPASIRRLPRIRILFDGFLLHHCLKPDTENLLPPSKASFCVGFTSPIAWRQPKVAVKPGALSEPTSMAPRRPSVVLVTSSALPSPCRAAVPPDYWKSRVRTWFQATPAKGSIA
ncbi:hypothetical protein D3C87_1510370 [compost metagenome]